MNKVFLGSSKFTNWLVQSSSDPEKVSMMVKGILVGIIPFLMQFLPLIGIKLSPDLVNIPDFVYGVVFYGLTAIGAVIAVMGFLRKIWNTLIPSQII